MPSGRKPNLERRRQVVQLRDNGLSLAEIARRFGVTKQAVWSLLHQRAQRTAGRAVPCSACGAMIVSPGALRRDADGALCLSCLRARPGVSFALRLKALRLAAGLSRTELAERSGVGTGSLRAYEDGRRKPHRSSAIRVAQVLGEELIGAAPRKGARKRLSDAS
jgi:transcriptional regulator with XRE-family HTH domain